MYVYNAAWFALAIVLTVVLGAAGVWTFRRRGWRPALFVAGLTLLPLALYLTGTLHVVGVILDQVTGYFVGFVFSPKVWLGIVLGGVGILLMLVSSALKRRGVGAPVRKGVSRSTPDQVPAAGGAAAPAASGDLDDLDDIEAILRKHGIS